MIEHAAPDFIAILGADEPRTGAVDLSARTGRRTMLTSASRCAAQLTDTVQTMANADDAHRTLGRRFRTPAHPEVVAALGRALFCFLSLEETVTAIIYDAGASDLSSTRSKPAGGKQEALEKLADRYRASVNGVIVAERIDLAVTAFGVARSSIRNELLHAHPFSAGTDDDGHYLPGLAYTAKDGKSWKTVARTPGDLLDLAEAIERAIDPLKDARESVRALQVDQLEKRDLAPMPGSATP